MRKIIFIFCLLIICSCTKKDENMEKEVKIIFLHHSTGKLVWDGKRNSIIRKITNKLHLTSLKKGQVQQLIEKYNRKNNTAWWKVYFCL